MLGTMSHPRILVAGAGINGGMGAVPRNAAPRWGERSVRAAGPTTWEPRFGNFVSEERERSAQWPRCRLSLRRA